jgi:integrase
MRSPFTLYQEKTKSGIFWYARFWDETSRKYAFSRSLGVPVEGKRERRREAEEAARAMLPGISSIPKAPDKPFAQYVADFWLPDSPYVRECALVKKKPLAAGYIKIHHEDVRRHIEPFPGFRGVTLHTLTPGLIRDWMTWIAGKDLGGGRINKIMQAMSVAVRYAVSRGELEKDPFKNIREAPDIRKEKGILSAAEVAALIHAPVTDPWGRLAVLLGLLCGMRMGKARGLQWRDIGDGLIAIRHNYLDDEGTKAPKWGSTRTVPVPECIKAVLEQARRVSRDPGPDRFVLESLECPGKPYSKSHLQNMLERELAAIGISGKWKPAPHKGKRRTDKDKQPPEGYVNEQRRRNITFHSLRHTYITLGRMAGISDLEIQTLAGHRSAKMMERYSHAAQVMDFEAAREKMEKVIGGKAGNA